MTARTRGYLALAAKVLVATVLIGWLLRSGVLDFGALRVLLREPTLLVVNLVVFVLAALLATVRWRTLLAALGVTIPFGRASQLQFIALFFNVVVPGNVGGDVVKALYVARDARADQRANVLLVSFIERLLGLAGLILMAALVTVVRARAALSSPQLRRMATIVMLLGAATIVGPALFFAAVRWAGGALDRALSGPSRIARLLQQLVAAVRMLAASPRSLLFGVLLSMTMHFMSLLFFTALIPAITHASVSFASVATIYPLGMLTLVLPISPAGIGVGHVAFNRLFEAIGEHGGATVFNVFLIAQITPSLVGVLPYLTLKRRGELPATA